MAQGPRGLAAFLFFLALSSTVRAREEVVVVEGVGFDGLYAEEGHGSTKYYKKLGGANSNGDYFYLYRGTERRGTWVLGAGKNFEARRAEYRAPAGSAAGQPPPVSGWKYVYDRSKDGTGNRRDKPNLRVTRLGQLDEKETAAGVFERGGGETVEGIICRTYKRGDVVCCFSV